MTITAALPPGVEFPEKTLLNARVWRNGDTIEITAEAIPAIRKTGRPEGAAGSEDLEAWLARCAAQPVCNLTDADLNDLRWQYLKDKHRF